MTKRTNSKVYKIRKLHAEQPSLTAAQIAAKLKIEKSYVSTQLWKLKRESTPILASNITVQNEARTEPTVADSKPLDTTAAILEERGKRYGAFVDHARVTQTLKYEIGLELVARDKKLLPDQMEALDMICHKIGRIVNGDPDYADSWADIAGYARLVADRLEGKVR